MKERISTKRALQASLATMVLCGAMLVGATFAWFTDSASTNISSVQSGTLGIDLQKSDGQGGWVSAEGQTINFIKASGAESEAILWEPGATYNLEDLRVVSTGNLALKYKIEIDGLQGDSKLNDVIEWTIGGLDIATEQHLAAGAMSDALTISGHMKETAGNEYQGLSITGVAVKVVATQDTVENDSISNQYDANAVYPIVETVSTASDYNAAVASLAGTSGKDVTTTVTDNINDAAGYQVGSGNTSVLDLGGNTVTVTGMVGSSGTQNQAMQLLKGSNNTLKNGTYSPGSSSQKVVIQNYSDLTIDNVTIDASAYSNCLYVISTNCGNVRITGNTNITAASGKTALDIMHWHGDAYGNAGSHVVIDESMTGTIDGAIEVYCYGAGDYPEPGATLTIMGGNFKNTGLTLDEFKAYVADGYKVVENGDVWSVVHA